MESLDTFPFFSYEMNGDALQAVIIWPWFHRFFVFVLTLHETSMDVRTCDGYGSGFASSRSYRVRGIFW